MNINDIMSKKIIVGSTTNTLSEIAELMKKYDIGFIPIVDKNKLVGVITDRDIVINAISNNCSFNDLIDKYVVKNIISIDQNKSIDDALNLMALKKVKRLIVTDNNKISGILTLSDILGKYDNEIILDTFKQIFEINRNDDLFSTEIDEFYL